MEGWEFSSEEQLQLGAGAWLINATWRRLLMRPGSSATEAVWAGSQGMCLQTGGSSLPASFGWKRIGKSSMPLPPAHPSPGARLWPSLRGFHAPWGVPAFLAAACRLNRFNCYCSSTVFLQGTACSVAGSPLAYPQYAACRVFAVSSKAGMKSGVI